MTTPTLSILRSLRRATVVGLVFCGSLDSTMAEKPSTQGETATWPACGVQFIVAVQSPQNTTDAERAKAVTEIAEILRERLKDMKIAFKIAPAPEDRLIVRVPTQPEATLTEIRKDLTRTGYIEFRLVHAGHSTGAEEGPIGYEQLTLKTRRDEKDFTEVLWVKRIPELTSDAIAQANAMEDSFGGYLVNLKFNDRGSSRFAAVTRRLAEVRAETGRSQRLAIVVDGTLITAPTVQDEITGGAAQITGSFTQRDALELAILLSNPINVRLRIDEERTFGFERE